MLIDPFIIDLRIFPSIRRVAVISSVAAWMLLAALVSGCAQFAARDAGKSAIAAEGSAEEASARARACGATQQQIEAARHAIDTSRASETVTSGASTYQTHRRDGTLDESWRENAIAAAMSRGASESIAGLAADAAYAGYWADQADWFSQDAVHAAEDANMATMRHRYISEWLERANRSRELARERLREADAAAQRARDLVAHLGEQVVKNPPPTDPTESLTYTISDVMALVELRRVASMLGGALDAYAEAKGAAAAAEVFSRLQYPDQVGEMERDAQREYDNVLYFNRRSPDDPTPDVDHPYYYKLTVANEWVSLLERQLNASDALDDDLPLHGALRSDVVRHSQQYRTLLYMTGAISVTRSVLVGTVEEYREPGLDSLVRAIETRADREAASIVEANAKTSTLRQYSEHAQSEASDAVGRLADACPIQTAEAPRFFELPRLNQTQWDISSDGGYEPPPLGGGD